MTAAGLKPKEMLRRDWNDLVAALHAAPAFAPVARPQVKPPVAHRPTSFSVSRIEKLVRDSYAVYANDILKLKPLDGVGRDMDAALRGTLIHDAIQQWTKTFSDVPVNERLALLLAKGEAVFKPYMDLPEVSRFWWPRFKRMAEEFVLGDEVMRGDTVSTRTEVDGEMPLVAAGVPHSLRARADRIDIERNGALRIIDYKSGAIPSLKQVKSGYAPQLTLEGAIALAQGFKGINSKVLDDVVYIGVGGGSNGVEVRALSDDAAVTEEAQKAERRLTALLAAFQDFETPYIPLHGVEKEDDRSDYDHLSRRLEWQMNGSGE
jgi:ATP-dependent helicase/nuclease subunit B